MAQNEFEVTNTKFLAFYEELLSYIDLKEELYALGLQLYCDEFFIPVLSVKEIEYTGPERQLTA